MASISIFNGLAMTVGAVVPLYMVEKNGMKSLLPGLLIAFIIQFIILAVWVQYEKSRTDVNINDIISSAFKLAWIMMIMSILAAFSGFMAFYKAGNNNIITGILGFIIYPMIWWIMYSLAIKSVAVLFIGSN